MIKLNRFSWGILFFVAVAAGQARAQSADNNDAQIAALKQQLRMMDPQPFHLDEAAARNSIFGGLCASGWHTLAVTMRLLLDSELKPAGGIIGAGLDECRWPRPVRPGDELRIECEVIEVRPSKSRPEQGLIKLRTTTLNQDGEAVLVHVVNLVVLRRKDIRQD